MAMTRKGADLLLLDPPSMAHACVVCSESPTCLLAIVWGESPEVGRSVIESHYFCPAHVAAAQQTFATLRQKYRV